MVDWRPTSGPAIASRRAERLAVVRSFFAERRVLEVDVPALSRFAVSDANIDSLVVTAAVAGNSNLYLATSPEYAMKRLLAAGYPDIFAVARVFRDGELGRRHEPEFTLVEWYRRGFGLEAMAAETCEFIAAVLDQPALAGNVMQLSFREAFARSAGIDPLDADVTELAGLTGADDGLVVSLGDDRDAWLDLLMGTQIAASFPDDRLTVVTHYPSSQAALAQLDSDDDSVALRFEVFFGALELANGYVELRDAEEQRQRFETELASRRAAGRQVAPLDETLLDALGHGLPAVAGVAVGFERLHMLYEGSDNIADVITFSFGS
jgi:lysyl-tRNA synthetase class 2